MPITHILLRAKHPNAAAFRLDELASFTVQEIYAWSDMIINGRMHTFMVNAISDETLGWLDSNPDFGIIAHSTTGRLFPFDYSKVTGISLCTVPNLVETALFDRYRDHISDDEDRELVDASILALNSQLDRNTMIITMDYPEGTDGDVFGPANRCSVATTRDWLDVDEVEEVKTYLTNMYQKHAKVMVIP